MNVAEFLNPDAWLLSDGGPRYLQLRQRISQGVDEGVLKVAVSLPPEREIATLTDLLRATVRKAIQSLVEEGLIVQRRGSGSFDASDAPRDDSDKCLARTCYLYALTR